MSDEMFIGVVMGILQSTGTEPTGDMPTKDAVPFQKTARELIAAARHSGYVDVDSENCLRDSAAWVKYAARTVYGINPVHALPNACLRRALTQVWYAANAWFRSTPRRKEKAPAVDPPEFMEGIKARRAGLPKDKNPYANVNGVLADLWDDGWHHESNNIPF